MKKWQCIVCGLIYNEADGWPDDGIAPGTLWQDVPEDWLCPDCGVGKMDFEMIEINSSTLLKPDSTFGDWHERTCRDRWHRAGRL